MRRGDIVVSFPETTPSSSSNFVYAHFETQKSQPNSSNDELTVSHKAWMPASMELYKIVNSIRKSYNPYQNISSLYPWEEYLSRAIGSLTDEQVDWSRPKEDKLFLNVGGSNLVEVEHPVSVEADRRHFGLPSVRFGKIGGGKSISLDEQLRHAVSEQYGIACFDSDVTDQVMESIEGNRKDSFIVIRGIADYADGTTSKEWHPYAALCAASFAKTLICSLPVSTYQD
jgi:hypothetical protein